LGTTDRLYQIERLIKARGHASFAQLQAALEVSRATLWRDLAYLRDRLGVPIEYDRFAGGYRFGAAAQGQRAELPGLWFNERELYALLMAHQLISELDADGTISRHLQPLLARVHQMLGRGGEAAGDAADLTQRVRIVGAAKRPVDAACFEQVTQALLQRRRLGVDYLTRARGTTSRRQLSPQRLVHYRSTWYLDAWCHTRGKLLRFALDAMRDAQVLEASAKAMALARVQREMDGGYGIFAGGARRWVTLHFTREAAAWVRHEQWHPQQRGRTLPDGGHELKLPYVDATELVMDILRHGDQVRVVPASDPIALEVARRLARARAQYPD
jgi:predicted DNA-binding transcriptional regulator YafY